MCAQYELLLSLANLTAYLKAVVDKPSVLFNDGSKPVRVLPQTTGLVIVQRQSSLRLLPMRFSLLPSWSKEPKAKFATFNARIESVFDKATWRIPFARNHCLVPVTGFFEAIYNGPHAGTVIRFTNGGAAEQSESLMFAAGIYDRWSPPSGGTEIESFAILTQAASPQVLEVGHERQPIFLPLEDGISWLSKHESGNEALRKWLLDSARTPPFTISTDRALAAGWEKRAKRASAD